MKGRLFMETDENLKNSLVSWLEPSKIEDCEPYQLDIILVEHGQSLDGCDKLREEVYRDVLMSRLDNNDELDVKSMQYLNLVAYLLHLYVKKVQQIHDEYLSIIFSNHAYNELKCYKYTEEIEKKLSKLTDMYHLDSSLTTDIMKDIGSEITTRLIDKYLHNKINGIEILYNFVESFPYQISNEIYPKYQQLLKESNNTCG